MGINQNNFPLAPVLWVKRHAKMVRICGAVICLPTPQPRVSQSEVRKRTVYFGYLIACLKSTFSFQTSKINNWLCLINFTAPVFSTEADAQIPRTNYNKHPTFLSSGFSLPIIWVPCLHHVRALYSLTLSAPPYLQSSDHLRMNNANPNRRL